MNYNHFYKRLSGKYRLSKRYLLVLAFSILIPVFLFSFSDTGRNETQGPRFNVKHRFRPSSELGRGLLTVDLEIPYHELLFLKNGEEFVSYVDISLYLYQENVRSAGDSWTERTIVNHFSQTGDRNLVIKVKKDFSVPLEDFKLQIVVTDIHTQRSRRYSDELKMAEMKGQSWVLGDLWMTDLSPDSSDMPEFLEFGFSASGYEGEKRFDFRILTRDNKVVKYGHFNTDLQDRPTDYTFKIQTKDLRYSGYILELQTNINGIDYRRTLEFQMQWYGINSLITDLSEAIQQMRYLQMTNFISPKDYQKIIDAVGDEQKNIFFSYWEMIDPTPKTERNELLNEYYRRINIANQNWSGHRAGWETDRGMVFTVFGEPDETEVHSYDLNSKPYIVWYYYKINRRFIFVDHHGFGDYQLAQPLLDLTNY
jgi:GWxTD domain-containing protein